jgi:hypothetical protein
MSKEYIIWGKPPHSDDETLLVCEKAGIANTEQAKRVVAQLTDVHGCRDCRIQVFSLGNGADVINMFRGAVA